MTWIDVVMFSFVALLTGLTIGFKLGCSIYQGTPSYDQGVRDGMEWTKRRGGGDE